MKCASTILILIYCAINYTHATDFTECAFIKCPDERCQSCRITPVTDRPVCVYKDKCKRCPAEKIDMCFIDPCYEWEKRCPSAAHCFSNYCDGCTAYYYDNDLRPITNCSQLSIDWSNPDDEKKRICSLQPADSKPDAPKAKCDAPATFYTYSRLTGECQSYTTCDKEGSMLENEFATLDECNRTCAGVPRCPTAPTVKDDCLLKTSAAIDGCPQYKIECKAKDYSCAANPCPPCHTCHEETNGICCIRVENCVPCSGACNNNQICQVILGKEQCAPDFNKAACRLPIDQGFTPSAMAPINKWAYNPQTGKCQLFRYYGCKGGNANRFDSEAECLENCGGVQDCDCIDWQSSISANCRKRFYTSSEGCPKVEVICNDAL